MGSVFLLLIFWTLSNAQEFPCLKRWYDQDSFVCVCDYRQHHQCDYPEPLGNLDDKHAVIYSTSKQRDRLERTEQVFESSAQGKPVIRINSTKRFQTILGFGGAITDAVVANAVSGGQVQLLVDQYFGPTGIGYSIVRIPIASCDFSLNEYSYLEKDQDFSLTGLSFNSDREKIDLIKLVLKTSGNRTLKLFASPWSAPGWMKTNGRMKGGAELRGDFNGIYYLTYARYLREFFIYYYNQGIKFWGMTVQNEPSTGLNPYYSFQTLYLSPSMQRDFVQLRLGPLLKSHWATKDLKIMAHDDDRDDVELAANAFYKYNNTFIDGIGVHWYSNRVSHGVLSRIHEKYPDKFILATEACNGDGVEEHLPLLGSWKYAEKYAHDIIQNMLNFVVGWTDWNLWLNEFGGPNWVGNFVDAPIIVNRTKGSYSSEFYKQPSFYVLAHFSMFVVPGSVRIEVVDGYLPVEAVAFETPDGNIAVVLLNTNENTAFEFAIAETGTSNRYIHVQVEPKSIKTILLKKKKNVDNRTKKNF